MAFGGRKASQEAETRHAEDVTLGAQFGEFMDKARGAEAELRRAQSTSTPVTELHRLGEALDVALTNAMRSAYAAERAAIGARGYDDRIYRRKQKATAPVKQWTAEADALLTLREAHRLGGIARVPPAPAR